MIDFNDKKTMVRLRDAMRNSTDRLKSYRENAKQYLIQQVGAHYGPAGEGTGKRIPFNQIEKAASIYNWRLAAAAPKILVTTESQSLLPMAADGEVVINRLLEQLGLERTLQQWVNSSLYALAVIKVGWKQTGVVADEAGQEHPVGEAFAKPISMWDWIHDMAARDIQNPSFQGHKYRMLLSDAKNNPAFSEEGRKALKPSMLTPYSQSRDRDATTIGRGGSTDPEEFQDHVDLWELYFPREQIIVTLPYESGPPLSIEPWRGPGGGPYHFLHYAEVSDNSMPLPPAAAWIDLHLLTNRVYRKLAEDAENQKKNMIYDEGMDEDATRIVKADNMEAISVSNVDRFKEITWNGPDQIMLAFLQAIKGDANSVMGNPDLLAGSAPQSPTATQDKLLHEGAGGRLQHMQDRVYAQTTKVIEHLAWYYWHDPVRTYKGVREIPNTQFHLDYEITPDMRENNFFHFNFKIQPYSMQRQSPQERISQLIQLVMEILPPLLPGLEQQGKYFDTAGLVKLIAKYNDLPELKQLIKDSGMTPDQDGPIGQPERGRQPAVTHRQTTRTSIAGGPTGPAKEMAMMQSLLSGAGNDKGVAIGA